MHSFSAFENLITDDHITAFENMLLRIKDNKNHSSIIVKPEWRDVVASVNYQLIYKEFLKWVKNLTSGSSNFVKVTKVFVSQFTIIILHHSQ